MYFFSKQYTFYSRLAIKKSISRGYQQFAAAVTLEGGSTLDSAEMTDSDSSVGGWSPFHPEMFYRNHSCQLWLLMWRPLGTWHSNRNAIWRGNGERKSTRPQDTYKLMTRDPFRGRKEVLSHTVLLKFEHGGMKVYNLEICYVNLAIDIHIGLLDPRASLSLGGKRRKSAGSAYC